MRERASHMASMPLEHQSQPQQPDTNNGVVKPVTHRSSDMETDKVLLSLSGKLAFLFYSPFEPLLSLSLDVCSFDHVCFGA